MDCGFEIRFPLILSSEEFFTIKFALKKGDVLNFKEGLYYLYGDNGSGKTTFVNLLALTAGCIGKQAGSDRQMIQFNHLFYNGKNFDYIEAAKIREKYFCIFPQKAFFLPVSTRDNYVVLNGSDPKKEAMFSSREYPDLLSGGQQQKILMDIVLDDKKKVWFLDEPLANLDAKRRHYFWMKLDEAWKKELKMIFFIDHLMGVQIKNAEDFRYCNSLYVTTENTRKNVLFETEVKKIEIYENRMPQKFFNRQIKNFKKMDKKNENCENA